MDKKQDWREWVDVFVRSRKTSFSLDDLIRGAGLGGKGRNSPGRVTRQSLVQYLRETGIAVTRDQENYLPVRQLFRDASCLVKPQKWEIDSDVLAPGHRFIPLYSYLILPGEIQLHLGRKKGGGLPRRTMALPFDRIFTYYTLFGWESILPLLAMEDEGNARVDLTDTENTLVRLSVFDMGDFYRRTGFAEGDYLRCRLLDWEQGTFLADHLPAADMDQERRDSFFAALEEAFEKVFADHGSPMDIPTQLLHAYFLGDESIRTNPGGTIGEVLAGNNSLQFIRRGMNHSSIWNAPEPPDHPFAPPGYDSPHEGVTGDLAEMLSDIGSVVTVGELEGFMRDALFHGKSWDHALERAFAGSHASVTDEAQARSFSEELHELWDHVSESYVPAHDTVTGPIRSRLLALYEKQLAFIRGLDARGIDPADLPAEPMNEVVEFFGMVVKTVELLNHPVGDDQDELETLAGQIPRLEEIASEVLGNAKAMVDARFPR